MTAPTPIHRSIESFTEEECRVIFHRSHHQSHGELARVFQCSVQAITAIVRDEREAAAARKDW